MRPLVVAGLISTVLSISIGQVLFKVAAERANAADTLYTRNVLTVLLAAVAIYACGTLIWVSVLRYVPLTVAYIFVSMTFAVVPALAIIFLHEQFSLMQLVGTALIISGILISLGAAPVSSGNS